ncbi:MAG: sterol desaturase family protein [bacterium]|nr:sterol desaturase family protein [bacterium]
MQYVIEFVVLFLILFLGFYILPAGIFHLLYHRKGANYEHIRIQNKKPKPKDLKREFRLSTWSVLIFSVGAFISWQFVKEGQSAFYYDWNEYPIYYAVLSFFICLIAHDTYFYWSHRFMHWPPVFKYFHLGHHRSLTPSPWAILAFQPLEAVIQFGTFALIIFLVPIHPVVFGIYVLYDSVVNTAGHNGFELVPKWFSKNKILGLGNTVTHHDLHHIHFDKNYGAFFNIWDRIMGTFLDDDASDLSKRQM